jgi:hypothetical protein
MPRDRPEVPVVGPWTAEIVIAGVAVGVLVLLYAAGAWAERRHRKRNERNERGNGD